MSVDDYYGDYAEGMLDAAHEWWTESLAPLVEEVCVMPSPRRIRPFGTASASAVSLARRALRDPHACHTLPLTDTLSIDERLVRYPQTDPSPAPPRLRQSERHRTDDGTLGGWVEKWYDLCSRAGRRWGEDCSFTSPAALDSLGLSGEMREWVEMTLVSPSAREFWEGFKEAALVALRRSVLAVLAVQLARLVRELRRRGLLGALHLLDLLAVRLARGTEPTAEAEPRTARPLWPPGATDPPTDPRHTPTGNNSPPLCRDPAPPWEAAA